MRVHFGLGAQFFCMYSVVSHHVVLLFRVCVCSPLVVLKGQVPSM